MTKKITFNLDKYSNIIMDRSIWTLVYFTNELINRIRDNSPVDTWRYLMQTRNGGITQDGKRLVSKIYNEWEYSERVEHWFRSSPVNWHLRSGNIYFAVGAKPFMRSLEQIKVEFINKLKAEIWSST